jgi:hypothetical protein
VDRFGCISGLFVSEPRRLLGLSLFVGVAIEWTQQLNLGTPVFQLFTLPACSCASASA